MNENQATNGDCHSGFFKHTRVDAATAPPASGNLALNSPFSMANAFHTGGDLTAESSGDRYSSIRAKPRVGSMAERAMAVLAACGPLTVAQLAEGLGISHKQAANVAGKGIDLGRLARTKNDGRETFYGLVTQDVTAPIERKSGFKHWLEKNGEQSAQAPRTKSTRPKKAAAPVAPPTAAVQPNTTATPPSAALRCGLFNDGSLSIICASGESITLTRQQTLELAAYLKLMNAALGAVL